jgi:hypothetical protein
MGNLQRIFWLGFKRLINLGSNYPNIEIEIHLQFSFQLLAVRLLPLKTRFILYCVFELNCMSLIKLLIFVFFFLVVTWHKKKNYNNFWKIYILCCLLIFLFLFLLKSKTLYILKDVIKRLSPYTQAVTQQLWTP